MGGKPYPHSDSLTMISLVFISKKEGRATKAKEGPTTESAFTPSNDWNRAKEDFERAGKRRDFGFFG